MDKELDFEDYVIKTLSYDYDKIMRNSQEDWDNRKLLIDTYIEQQNGDWDNTKFLSILGDICRQEMNKTFFKEVETHAPASQIMARKIENNGLELEEFYGNYISMVRCGLSIFKIKDDKKVIGFIDFSCEEPQLKNIDFEYFKENIIKKEYKYIEFNAIIKAIVNYQFEPVIWSKNVYS